MARVLAQAQDCPLRARERASGDQPLGVRRNCQILVVKDEIDKESSQKCHRPKAFYARPVVFRLGGSAFCVMRTSLGNPRAGALLFWARSKAKDRPIEATIGAMRAPESSL